MNTRPQAFRYIQGFLLALCGLLSLSTIYELARPYELSLTLPPVEPDKQTGVEALQGDAIRSVPQWDVFSDIIERPLFREDRRPYAAPVSTGPAESKKHHAEPDITTLISLSAVVLTRNKRIALIEENRTSKLQQLRPGETFNGWALTNIRTDSIVMRKGGNVRRMELVVKPSRTVQDKSEDMKLRNNGNKPGMAAPGDKSENVESGE